MTEITTISTEKRSAPTTWDLLKTGADYGSDAGVPVSPFLAENLSVVLASVNAVAETTAMLPLGVFRKLEGGDRLGDPAHPVAQIFNGSANDWQTGSELVEMMTAHCLLRGNAYAEIKRDGRGVPVALVPYHPDHVSLVRIPRTGRYRYDVSLPEGGTRNLLPEEMLHLKDRTDDGIIGKSRLQRARETFGTAIATERYAATTFKNGASMSGVLSHPEALGEEAAARLKKDFQQTYTGSDKAGSVAVLEEGLKWMQVSVSPDDAQMLESRKFSVEALARVFRVPPPVIGSYEGGNYSSIQEVGKWFYAHTICPWLTRWENLIQRSLLSEVGRRNYEVEFDADLLLRGDMLTRFQAYRIGREIGTYNANDTRRFEKLNKRTDPGGETFFEPRNMAPEQTRQPVADRGGGDNAAA